MRIADGVNHCHEAAALLTATSAALSGIQDAQARQLALDTLEAVERLEARLQLLGQAYRIADEHRAKAPLDLAGVVADRQELSPAVLGAAPLEPLDPTST